VSRVLQGVRARPVKPEPAGREWGEESEPAPVPRLEVTSLTSPPAC